MKESTKKYICIIRLFVDDTLMYLTLKPKSNAAELHEGLDKLAKLEMSWKMEFHPQNGM